MIAEIVTEKITYELEAETAGTVLKILLEEEVDVPVGTPLVVIGSPARTRPRPPAACAGLTAPLEA